ncbi:hypothetical protein UA08_05197 [Talaromyces atroroseus]|uniref:Dolichyl-diphosphooligosaccharide--protein glycosyltransferase subunit 4 n=1 Tax=Talaromyces atroroseus TaxID=1441469 RepID=A0A225AQJ3_TALAT|nr:hypothetical protein UA08_05197 [Talaromyces atroroseus]OKL59518.1 hypothetical protein UA08_05197 [Talaromyces atroroseus]
MIADSELYRLALFLGAFAMLLIVLYHFLEVNSEDNDDSTLTSFSSSDGKPASTDKKIPANADPLVFAPAAAVASRGKAT